MLSISDKDPVMCYYCINFFFFFFVLFSLLFLSSVCSSFFFKLFYSSNFLFSRFYFDSFHLLILVKLYLTGKFAEFKSDKEALGLTLKFLTELEEVFFFYIHYFFFRCHPFHCLYIF